MSVRYCGKVTATLVWALALTSLTAGAAGHGGCRRLAGHPGRSISPAVKTSAATSQQPHLLHQAYGRRDTRVMSRRSGEPGREINRHVDDLGLAPRGTQVSETLTDISAARRAIIAMGKIWSLRMTSAPFPGTAGYFADCLRLSRPPRGSQDLPGAPGNDDAPRVRHPGRPGQPALARCPGWAGWRLAAGGGR